MRCGVPTILFLLAACGGALAQGSPPDTTVTEIPDLTVTAEATAWGDGRVDGAVLDERPAANLAEALEQLPGVAAVRRAASAAEPVIRGLGWERVRTVLGAVPLYGACPGRMDPPATYLTPLTTSEVSIFRSGGRADFGPGATGGSIHADPDYERSTDAEPGVTPFVGAAYESARQGWLAEGGLFGGTEAVDYKLGLGRREFDDYTAPDGTVVPAGLKSTHAAASLGWRLRPGQRLWGAATVSRERDVDFPAMPMDNIESDFAVLNGGWRVRHDAGILRQLELEGGVSWVDHLMDNRNKPNRPMMEASTDAYTRSWAAHARADLAPGRDLALRTGLNVTSLWRDATRTRRMVMTGMTAFDRLWPDAVQTAAGGFAALEIPLAGALRLTVDGRLDAVDSKARAADAPSLGGRSVREWYTAYYGPEAAETDVTETLGAASLRLDGQFAPARVWYLRTGLSTRAAGVTERYYAFGPAPGGYQVGNPTLAAEKKLEFEGGVSLSGKRAAVSLSVFHARTTDHVLAGVIDVQDFNGDGNDDLIKGFTNVDAWFTGGEIGLEARVREDLVLPLTLSYVRGRNRSGDRDLPEIPPLSGRAEIRWRAHAATATWLRGGATFAADQDEVDPLFPEDRTPGWAVWHLGLETRPAAGLTLRARLDNLFDRLYGEHLTREALLATGGLAPGQEIPAPGRSLNLSARMEF